MNISSLFTTVVCITSLFIAQTTCGRRRLNGIRNGLNTASQSNKPASGSENGDASNASYSGKTPPAKAKDGDLSAKEIARLSLPSVVLVICNNGDEIVQGSGFFLKPGVVVTNYHVVRGTTKVAVRIEFSVANGGKNSGVSEVIAYDEESDLAILNVTAAKEAGVSVLALANENESIEVGETVYALGNPEGLVETFSPGIVSARLRSSEKSARLQITAPISPGSSGGPIINGKGKVVGVAVSTLSEGQNLNFAVPTILIYSIIKISKLASTTKTK